jgi:phenylacetate-CoA ligase
VIRYDLGDRVRFVPGPCACGSALPVIEVQSRADDVLTLEASDGPEVHLAPLALTTVLEDEAGIFNFQLCQRGPRSLRLDAYGSGPHAGAAAALRKFLRQQRLGTTRAQSHSDAHEAERGRSGKQRRVITEHAAAAEDEAASSGKRAASHACH